MFFEVFTAVLAALLVNQLINFLAIYVWWHEPFSKEHDNA